MPSIHVVLDCGSPTREPDRFFHALVQVSDQDLTRGEHVRIARRQAMIRGYGGPHRVVTGWNAVTGMPLEGAADVGRDVPASATRLHERLTAAVREDASAPAVSASRWKRAAVAERAKPPR